MVGAFELRRILPHHRLPLRLRDLVLAHPEVPPGDLDHLRHEPLHRVARVRFRAAPALGEPDGARGEGEEGEEEGEAFHCGRGRGQC